MVTRSHASPGAATRWLPSAILLAGVLVFALAVSSARAATWTGPGFSMFSAADYRATRFVQLTLETPSGLYAAYVPDSEAVEDSISVPSTDNLRSVGFDALDMSWTMTDGVLVPDMDGDITATAARVELWTPTIRSDHLWPELINSVELRR